jgi:hypothetical protein
MAMNWMFQVLIHSCSISSDAHQTYLSNQCLDSLMILPAVNKIQLDCSVILHFWLAQLVKDPSICDVNIHQKIETV